MNDQEIKSEFEKIWKKISEIEKQTSQEVVAIPKSEKNLFSFKDKSLDHTVLLEELLKSEFCHSRDGITKNEILLIFKKNGRPVVPKKITDLLHVWKKRKRIDAIKVKGNKQLRYFWIENEPNKSNR